MPHLGAHMSIAGGLYRAVEAAHRAGCDCVQLFTKNNNQWAAKELRAEDCERFAAALRELRVEHPIAHNSYLINLASPDAELWRKSIDAMVVELQRADALGVPYVVAHPGAYTTSSEEAGLRRIAAALDEIHAQTGSLNSRVLLETTAGQGTNLGWRFEHLAEILSLAGDPDRLGVCFDTCHVFAAGYAMADRKDYLATMRRLDRTVGCDRVKAFHLNDSLKPLGSRVDRHAAIGRGEMGLEPFRHLLNDRRFRSTPMYLETPKGEEDGVDLDVVNLRALRELVSARR
ncbi:deoxyribonuclease IV [Botrimarina sp.]|uniref:deoxyribonuclease IV n=1 Tax=Botrimarina sp. TaxID=2795802 RepID=UPI0032EFF3B3